MLDLDWSGHPNHVKYSGEVSNSTLQARRLEFRQLIDEKVLQRYAFEKLSISTKERAKLLPESLRGLASRFKVLIPEFPLYSPAYRTDFRLLFKGSHGPVNVEVEWSTRDFHRHHGEPVASSHFRNGRGFLIVLEDDRTTTPTYMESMEVVRVEAEEFAWWFDKNSRMLLDATLAFHGNQTRTQKRRYWVVYLGRDKGAAMKDYIEKGRGNGVWAFRYAQGKNLTNILSISKGDTVVFAGDWHVKQGRRIYPGADWSCSMVDIFNVTHGYWCDFVDKTFERHDWSDDIDQKEYMHYFRFKPQADREHQYKSSRRDNLRGLDFGEGEIESVLLCDAFRKSNTQRGSPVEIGEDVFTYLRRRLD